MKLMRLVYIKAANVVAWLSSLTRGDQVNLHLTLMDLDSLVAIMGPREWRTHSSTNTMSDLKER